MCDGPDMPMTLLLACVLGGLGPSSSSSSSSPTLGETWGKRCADPVDPVMNGITIGGVVGGLVGGASLVGVALLGATSCAGRGPCEGPGLALYSVPAGVVVGAVVGAVAGGVIGAAVEGTRTNRPSVTSMTYSRKAPATPR